LFMCESAAAVATSETPAWFISGPSLASVGEQRAAAQRESALATLKAVFPAATPVQLTNALNAGGDLTTIVDRLLAEQFVEEIEAQPQAPDPEVAAAGPRQSEAGPSDASASGSDRRGPKRRVRFQTTSAVDPMDADGTADMSRCSDEELCEQMASSGISSEPTAGSARAASGGASEALDELLRAGTLDTLRLTPPGSLARGALKLSGRVVKTANELEAGLVGEKIVTKFVIECTQLSFRWEVSRRYSEFHHFHELLALQWDDLPPLPPKLLLSQGADDVAQRMLELDGYLVKLLATPAVALSPLVCTFLDALDLQSFRAQLLPRLEHHAHHQALLHAQHEQTQQSSHLPQMDTCCACIEASDATPGALPTRDDAPNGW